MNLDVNLMNDVEEALYGQGLAAVALALVDAGKAMQALLDLVGTNGRACRYCGAQLVMVQHANKAGKEGKGWAPYDYPAGTNHFATCSQAAQVRVEVAARRAAKRNEPQAPGGLSQAAPGPVGGLVQAPPEPPQPSERPPLAMAAGAGVQGTMFEAAADPRRWMRS